MPVTQSYSPFGSTPRAIQMLIAATVGISIFAGLFDRFFTVYLGVIGPQQLLSLSWWGIANFMIWQPISYLFVHHAAGGISLFFFIELLFHMYLLWMMGSAVISHIETKSFLILYFLSGLLAGVAALATMAISGHYGVLVGAGPAIFALLALWAMLFPEQELLLFFAIQVKAKWLVVGLLAIVLLIDLSHATLFNVIPYLTGSFTGYAFGLISLDVRGPFPQIARFDEAVARIGQRFRSHQERTQRMISETYDKAKIFDFKTGQAILDDNAFMDAMLSKISVYGEDSLTRKERKRMKQISADKAKKKSKC